MRDQAITVPVAFIDAPAGLETYGLDKPAVAGMRFMAGTPIYRIVDLSTVWVTRSFGTPCSGWAQAGSR